VAEPPVSAATAATGFGASRIVLGLVGLAAPGVVARAFGLVDSPSMRVAARHLAGRDLVGGLGIVMAARHDRARGWLEAAALVDGIDAAVAVVAGRQGAMPRGRARLVTLVAGGSAVTALALARQLSSSSTTASAS
jgi:hypothetical protein